MSRWSPLVYLEEITKVFRNGAVASEVLTSINLAIQEGEFVAVVGPSGCGKSTLLAIMGLMDTPTNGVYCYRGEPVHTLNVSARAQLRNREIGYVFQNFNLIGDLSVFENVEQPLSYQKMKPAERQKRVQSALECVGMLEQARRRPSQLSGGEQQRVAIARAIVGEPKLLLADEPTGNLDSKSGGTIMELLCRLHARGTTICLVTHDPRFIHLANRQLHMLDGRIVEKEEFDWARI